MSEKERKVVEYFLNNPNAYISEISVMTDIPKSTVQRYLKKYEDLRINDDISIGEQLEKNRLEGRKKGGINSFKNNDFKKDEKGRFIGSTKTTSEVDKYEKKLGDIRVITNYYLMDPTVSLDELRDILTETFGFRRSYIYNCLTDDNVCGVIGEEKYKKIQELLGKNRYTFFTKTDGIDFSDYLNSSGLTDKEVKIVQERINGSSIDSIAKDLEISRARVIVYEDRAISKLKDNYHKGNNK